MKFSLQHVLLFAVFLLLQSAMGDEAAERTRSRRARQIRGAEGGNAVYALIGFIVNVGICFGCLAGGYFCGKSAGRNEAMGQV